MTFIHLMSSSISIGYIPRSEIAYFFFFFGIKFICIIKFSSLRIVLFCTPAGQDMWVPVTLKPYQCSVLLNFCWCVDKNGIFYGWGWAHLYMFKDCLYFFPSDYILYPFFYFLCLLVFRSFLYISEMNSYLWYEL